MPREFEAFPPGAFSSDELFDAEQERKHRDLLLEHQKKTMPAGETLQEVRIDCEKILDKLSAHLRIKSDINTILRRAHDAGERRGIAKANGAPVAPPVEEEEKKPIRWSDQHNMFFTTSAAGRMCSHDGVEWRLWEPLKELPKSPPPVVQPALELERTNDKPAGLCCRGGAKSFGKCRGCHGC